MLEAIKSDAAPAAIGPYSQAIRTGNIVFCSGQLGLDTATGKLVSDDAAVQAEACLRNLGNVLAAAGLTLHHVAKTTIFLANMQDFEKVNAVYARAFGESRPARSTVQVAALPKGAMVEIEAIAVSDS